MICRANGLLLYYFFFKYFFKFCAIGDKYTFSVQHGGYTLVPEGKTPKNWQDKWLWVNRSLVGSGQYQANTLADIAPKLFPHNQAVADLLKVIQVAPEDYSEALLTGAGMSPSWWRRGKMHICFTVVDGK